ncbi:MAG: MlaD family protein [Bacteroidaceae bacterium]|nr:MlaD family protein [Bacteroidaceae bacterium]
MKKEFKIGLFTIAGLLLLILGISFLKGLDIFSKKRTYYMIFDDVQMLSTANQVFVNGYEAGRVSSIDFNYNSPNNVIVGIDINPKMNIPKDSYGKLESSILGDITIHLILGKDKEMLQDGDTIRGIIPINIFSELEEKIVPELEELVSGVGNAISSINSFFGQKQIDRIMQDADYLIQELQRIAESFNRETLSALPEIAGKADSLEEKLLELIDNIQTDNLQETLANANSMLEQISILAEKLNDDKGSLGKFINQDNIHNNIDTLVESLNTLIDNIQKNPKKYMKISVF